MRMSSLRGRGLLRHGSRCAGNRTGKRRYPITVASGQWSIPRRRPANASARADGGTSILEWGYAKPIFITSLAGLFSGGQAD